ncbi:MAG: bifunctional adenosylcobinamide kinase/adenosylcobinamide-phosphate guanylyltransferase [Lachnospiraceae bacterium]|nr:bifunctional adenosylcobinamide kinase/adenosylcobinamide-phosphate guanylyltransferase [Lachnospiraceae bacterium]
MMTLILGGSGSGKSAYAEDYITALSGNTRKYYIATMQVSGPGGREKVKRHQKLRSGKGFVTIEQPLAIHRAADRMDTGAKTALLECISNLTANEMFSNETPKKEELVTAEIVKGITALKEELTHLVVVSNNVFEDGRVYDDRTMAYIRAMGQINERLAALADEVVEVVVGIPVILKQVEAGDCWVR